MQTSFVDHLMQYPMFDGDYSTATDDELFNSHMKLVYSMAKKKYYYHSNFDDIVQVGLLALHVAVKKYDRNSGIKFASYAMHRIRFDMQKFVLDDRIIRKVKTHSTRKIYHHYMDYSENDSWKLSDAMAEKFASDHNVSVKQIREFEDSMRESYISIDQPSKEDSTEFDIEFEGNTPEQEYEIQEGFVVHSKAITNAISYLSDREKEILSSRFLTDNPIKLETLSEKFNVSIERIRQIERASLIKMKKELSLWGYTKEAFF